MVIRECGHVMLASQEACGHPDCMGAAARASDRFLLLSLTAAGVIFLLILLGLVLDQDTRLRAIERTVYSIADRYPDGQFSRTSAYQSFTTTAPIPAGWKWPAPSPLRFAQ